MKHYHEKNTYLLNHSVNKTFDEVLHMTDDEFIEWIKELRKQVVYAWDQLGTPPKVGPSEEEIIDQFSRLASFDTTQFITEDLLDNHYDNYNFVIRNTQTNLGIAVNSWFPTMMKTRINYKNSTDGLSIYDHFVKDELLDKVLTYAKRHFKRDSFYHHSNPIVLGDILELSGEVHKVENWDSFFEWFENKVYPKGEYDFWIELKDDIQEYTGYNSKLKGLNYLQPSDVIMIDNTKIRKECLTNFPKNAKIFNNSYMRIRLYKKGQKLFPSGFKAFRISWCQYAVNFPPLTAKLLYEKFTDHIKDQNVINIYDPSAGWGGRILGAMAVKNDRKIHYIGTDPNTDHSIPTGTKYSDIADFYNKVRNEGVLFKHFNTYEIFQLGSEEIHKNKEFQKYKGKIDLVFTSPPYFAKEAYSDDVEQSYKKFDEYVKWRDGFLKTTLEVAVKYLRSNRYLLWNVSDVKFGNDMLPLVEDSYDILRQLGMEYKGMIKMSLAQMPGGNRIDSETGKPKAKYTCKLRTKDGEAFFKYEPIMVWKKT